MNDQDAYPGISWNEEGYIAAMAPMEDDGQLAVALADGRVVWRLLDRPETCLVSQEAHQGLTALCPGFAEGELISIGEDGRVVRHEGHAMHELAHFEKVWLEQIARHEESGLLAVAYKKSAVVLDSEGGIVARFDDHPSAVTGLAFDPKGKRLAVSHYNGASLWWVRGEAGQTPQRLNWKGSHLGINWSPNGKYLLSVMQENALHGWRLPDFDDFAMSGYALKPKSVSWDHQGRWLATSGSPGIVCWDCGGKGPMGRPASLLAEECPDPTVKVACHPELPLVAAGTSQGLVYIAQMGDGRVVRLRTGGQSEITALAWSASGRYLVAGSEKGEGYIWQFSE